MAEKSEHKNEQENVPLHAFRISALKTLPFHNQSSNFSFSLFLSLLLSLLSSSTLLSTIFPYFLTFKTEPSNQQVTKATLHIAIYLKRSNVKNKNVKLDKTQKIIFPGFFHVFPSIFTTSQVSQTIFKFPGIFKVPSVKWPPYKTKNNNEITFTYYRHGESRILRFLLNFTRKAIFTII